MRYLILLPLLMVGCYLPPQPPQYIQAPVQEKETIRQEKIIIDNRRPYYGPPAPPHYCPPPRPYCPPPHYHHPYPQPRGPGFHLNIHDGPKNNDSFHLDIRK